MDSAQFITWLEQKLKDVGAQKVVPSAAVLEKAYRRQFRQAAVQDAIDKLVEEYSEDTIDVPTNLEDTIRKAITGTSISWDDALFDVARAPVAQRRVAFGSRLPGVRREDDCAVAVGSRS